MPAAAARIINRNIRKLLKMYAARSALKLSSVTLSVNVVRSAFKVSARTFSSGPQACLFELFSPVAKFLAVLAA